MKNNDNTNRNKILKIFRKYKQLTQQQVADKANINYRQYQKCESGERDVMNAHRSTRGLMSIFSGSYGSLGGNRFSFSSFFFIMFSPFIFPDNSLLYSEQIFIGRFGSFSLMYYSYTLISYLRFRLEPQ